MILDELLQIINESTIVILYDAHQEILATYDGKESIPEYYNEFNVNDIFADNYHNRINHCKISAIGIELEFYKEMEAYLSY